MLLCYGNRAVFCLPRWLLGFGHVHTLARPFSSVHVFWRLLLPNPHSRGLWVHMYVDALFAQGDAKKKEGGAATSPKRDSETEKTGKTDDTAGTGQATEEKAPGA